MAKYKVVMADSLFTDQDMEKEILKEIDAEFILSPARDQDTLAELASDCDALITTFSEITKKVIDGMEKCKVIIRSGIGVNNVDIEAATEKNIMVANVQNYCIEEVADHAMALMLSSLRKIVVYNNSTHRGIWDMNVGRQIPRISRTSLGLYGFGNIARAVAHRALSFGMEVLAYDPFISTEVFQEMKVKKIDDLSELFSQSDVLSIHLPLSDKTRKIVDASVFEQMKPSAFLINVARGGLIDEEALTHAIENKLIAGCGLDVMYDEPGDLHSRLLTYENVIITPHAAFYSDYSDVELRRITTEQVVETFTKGQPRFWLNKF